MSCSKVKKRSRTPTISCGWRSGTSISLPCWDTTYADIVGYDRDVLLLHGDADTIVPFSASERALEAFPSASLEVLPGAGHGFSGEDESTAIRLIEDYLQSHLV